ncbi:hypothetical protein, partial [Mesorhizobium sp. 14Argb]
MDSVTSFWKRNPGAACRLSRWTKLSKAPLARRPSQLSKELGQCMRPKSDLGFGRTACIKQRPEASHGSISTRFGPRGSIAAFFMSIMKKPGGCPPGFDFDKAKSIRT